MTISALPPLDRLEAWFVTGSQTMYGDANLKIVSEHAAQLAAELDRLDAIPVRIVPKPTATGPEAILQLCREAGEAEHCVGIVAWMHTFSPAKMWIAGLGALQKPLLHLHTQFNRDLPWAEIDMEFMNLAQSAHGDREFGHLATRMGISRKTVVGHVSDPSVGERIGLWSRAAAGRHEAHALRVARFGDNMREVAVTEGDKVEAQIRLGVSVNGYGVGELAEAVAQTPEAAVDALVAEYDEAYEVAGQLRAGGPRREALRDAARIEAGLRTTLGARGARAFTDTFEDLGALRQLPGIAAQRLMGDGFGFGPEGDWKTAALLRVMKVMATGLAGGTSFMEDYTYDLAPDGPKVLGSHMLEVCPSIAAGRPSCEIHPLSIGAREDPVRLVFTAAAGAAVNIGLIDLGPRFRLIANLVDIVPPDQELPNLPVARALWKPRPAFASATEAWLLAGGPHHTVLTTALGIEPLIDFAEMVGIELLVIDDELTIPGFKNELRWNQAYHHLAGGL
jgi:L-arabinose isomerase